MDIEFSTKISVMLSPGPKKWFNKISVSIMYSYIVDVVWNQSYHKLVDQFYLNFHSTTNLYFRSE